MELEIQLSENNTIVDFLTLKISKSNCSHNIIQRNHEEKDIEGLSNKVVIIGESMLNNINNSGLSKSKEVDVLNFPRATSADVLTKIGDVLNKKLAP